MDHPLHVGADLSQERPVHVKTWIDDQGRRRWAVVHASRIQEEQQDQRAVEDGPGCGNPVVCQSVSHSPMDTLL